MLPRCVSSTAAARIETAAVGFRGWFDGTQQGEQFGVPEIRVLVVVEVMEQVCCVMWNRPSPTLAYSANLTARSETRASLMQSSTVPSSTIAAFHTLFGRHARLGAVELAFGLRTRGHRRADAEW